MQYSSLPSVIVLWACQGSRAEQSSHETPPNELLDIKIVKSPGGSELSHVDSLDTSHILAHVLAWHMKDRNYRNVGCVPLFHFTHLTHFEEWSWDILSLFYRSQCQQMEFCIICNKIRSVLTTTPINTRHGVCGWPGRSQTNPNTQKELVRHRTAAPDIDYPWLHDSQICLLDELGRLSDLRWIPQTLCWLVQSSSQPRFKINCP